MRSEAARTIHDYAMRPVQSDIYQANILDKGGAMLRALRDWEKRRGITFDFKGKFIAPRSKKQKEPEEITKPEAKESRSIRVPREISDPEHKKQTAEQKRLKKNERNRIYRSKNREACKKRSKAWRASLTPEQRKVINERLKNYRHAKRAAEIAQKSAVAAGDSGHGKA